MIAKSMMDVASDYKELFSADFGSDLFSQWQESLRQFGFEWSAPKYRVRQKQIENS